MLLGDYAPLDLISPFGMPFKTWRNVRANLVCKGLPTARVQRNDYGVGNVDVPDISPQLRANRLGSRAWSRLV